MNKRRITTGFAAVAVIAASGLWLHRRADAHETTKYRTATVVRGTIRSTVSATGSLNAVQTVQVGTQVSGQLSAIYADFNSQVKKGQLLARIDPVLEQQAVQDAQAGVEKAQAQLTQAQADYTREKTLYDQQVVTASEFDTYQSNFSVQEAALKSAQIALDKAKQNLAYTNIYSPIDGVIIERDVDVGQTVAASLSAPQLFLIANDLSDMQILASVDESDIGQISDGMPVQFTVQAYPNETFTGKVQQVRLESKTADNVVNYTVVVAVKNDKQKLMPGMTATIQFETGSADSVLTVPNAALRFRPTPDMVASVAGAAQPDSAQRARWAAQRGTNGQHAAAAGAAKPSTLWYLDEKGTVHAARVRVGMTDGQKTEVQAKDLKEGMSVIIGVDDGSAPASATKSATANPLQPQMGGRGGPRGF